MVVSVMTATRIKVSISFLGFPTWFPEEWICLSDEAGSDLGSIRYDNIEIPPGSSRDA